MKREEKEEMNRDEKEVKQLRLSSLFTICTDGRSPPQSSMMTLFMFKIVKRMKICQKQKQKCKKQLCKRKGCFVGLGRLSRFPCCVLSYFSLVFVMEQIQVTRVSSVGQSIIPCVGLCFRCVKELCRLSECYELLLTQGSAV